MQGHTVYCVSKAGLNMLTLSLARELGPQIRVNGVSPGAILWPERELPDKAKDKILGRTALKRGWANPKTSLLPWRTWRWTRPMSPVKS
jgi:pteridine reductase